MYYELNQFNYLNVCRNENLLFFGYQKYLIGCEGTNAIYFM